MGLGRARTDIGWAVTAEISRPQVAWRATMAELARRWIADQATTGLIPRGRVASTVYKGGRLVRDSYSD